MSRTQAGQVLALGELIQSAGEAAVYPVRGRHVLVFKKYHQPTQARLEKLEVMVAAPPSDPTWEKRSHRSIAWPHEVVVDDHGAFEGYVMPRIVGGMSMSAIYHPQDRRALGWEWTWRHLLRVAHNTASAIDALHRHRYVIGDINTENILVKLDTLITVIDCDSMQIPGPAGQLYRCPVGTPDFTAPEITAQLGGRGFEAVDRTEESDAFALAILIHLLLMEGTHPYAGAWQAPGDPPDRAVRMREGLYAFGPDSRVTPPKGAPPFDVLPKSMQDLFLRAFVTGASQPNARPRADEWRRTLAALDKRLVSCRSRPYHVYPDHTASCPWCARVRHLGVADPFPDKTARPGRSTAPRPQPRTRPVAARTTARVPPFAPISPGLAPRPRRRAVKIATVIAAVLFLATMGRFTQAESGDLPPDEAATVTTAPRPSGTYTPLTTPTTTVVTPSTAPAGVTDAQASDLIVFSQTHPNRRVSISSVSPDGTRLRSLESGYKSVHPAVSPDGKHIAYARHGDFAWKLYVAPITGGRGEWACPISVESCHHPSWAPDGTRLAYTCNASICVINVDGTGYRVIHTGLDETREPSFSPDGTRLVVVGRVGEDEDLYMIEIEANIVTRMTEIAGAVGSPEWSPDGNRIAFTHYPDGYGERRADIYVVKADGTDMHQLTGSSARDEQPTWSPDGKRIAFVSDRNELTSVVDYPRSAFMRPQLFIMNSDGSEPEQITEAEARDPDWAA